jgi:CheY-like chemotaxis protein
MTRRTATLLIIEDNPTDVMIMQEALSSASVHIHLHVAADGVAGLEYLRRTGAHTDAARPDLILLDLNMPGKDGHEILAEIKTDDDLRSIPVVAMTTSQADDDVARAYGGHANCYIRKPMDFARFVEVVRSIEYFWFNVVTLP